MDLKKFFFELKRRNVYKVALTYAITSWILAQIVALAADTFGAPDWVTKIVFVILVIGFPIALILAWAFEMSPTGMIRTSSSAAQTNPSQANKKKPFAIYLIIGILAVALIGQFAYNKYAVKKQVLATNMEKTIAVLPFHNDSSNEENLYFCNGMVEEILNSLQKISELEVKSRTSVEKYRNPSRNLKLIAKELDVNYILEGSVRKSGDDLRITSQLINAQTGNHLWSETYDGKYSERIFEFQTDIAKKIAGSLNAIITPTEEERINKIPTSNIVAYDLILKAREEHRKYWNSGDTLSLNKAELLYDKVMKLDPEYAPSWIYKGSIYFDRRGLTDDYFKESYLDSVIWYCDKALSYDSNSDHAYLLRGMAYHSRGEIDKAIENYKKALELNRNDHEVLRMTLWMLGSIYMYKNEFSKAIPLLEEAATLGKKSNSFKNLMLSRLGMAYIHLGEFKEAKKYYDKETVGMKCRDFVMLDFYQGKFQEAIETIDVCCNGIDCNYFEANIYLQLKNYDKAANLFKKNRKKAGWVKWITNKNSYREGFALIQIGEKEKGTELIEEQLIVMGKERKLGRPSGYDYHFAAIYAFQGDSVRAIEHLRLYDQKILEYNHYYVPPIRFAQYDALFENIWDNQEFKELIKNDSARNKEIASHLRDSNIGFK